MRLLGRRPRPFHPLSGGPGSREPFLGQPPRTPQLDRVRQSRLHAAQLGAQRVPDLPRPLLRQAQPLVAQHLGEERRALPGLLRDQDRELFLPGEVGVGKLFVRHADDLLEPLGHGAERVGYALAVLEQLRVVQAAQHAVFVPAQPELELDFHVRPALGREPADGFAVAARRRRPVDRPGQRLQQRGLARPVRPEDARNAGAELDRCVQVDEHIRRLLDVAALVEPERDVIETPTRR